VRPFQHGGSARAMPPREIARCRTPEKKEQTCAGRGTPHACSPQTPCQPAGTEIRCSGRRISVLVCTGGVRSNATSQRGGTAGTFLAAANDLCRNGSARNRKDGPPVPDGNPSETLNFMTLVPAGIWRIFYPGFSVLFLRRPAATRPQDRHPAKIACLALRAVAVIGLQCALVFARHHVMADAQ